MSFPGSLILMTSGFMLLPASLFFVLSKRIQRQPLSDRDAHKLLYGLLGISLILLIAMYVLERPIFGFGVWFPVFSTPLMMTLVAVASLHIWQTPALHNRRTIIVLTTYLAAAIFVSAVYTHFSSPYADGVPIILAIFGAGFIAALIWQTVHGHNSWLWLGIGLLIAAASIYNFAYNELLTTFPDWLLWLLDIASKFLIPIVLITLAGRVAVFLAKTPHTIQWHKWIAGAIAAGLLVMLMYIDIVDLFLLDGFADWGVIGLPVFFGVLAITVTMLLLWTLERHRVPIALAYLVVMAIIISSFFWLLLSVEHNPEVATLARAEQVDQAIQAYFADNGSYPATLYGLIPRYLLTIPNPVLYSDQMWCYEGEGDFYRLASVYSPVWGAPVDAFSIRLHNSVGDVPVEFPACEALLERYSNRWGVPLL